MNIAEFITWFINEFIKIGTNILNKLDNIYITDNVSLLEFTITITIIGIFINIILTLPNNINRISSRYERKQKNDSKQ